MYRPNTMFGIMKSNIRTTSSADDTLPSLDVSTEHVITVTDVLD